LNGGEGTVECHWERTRRQWTEWRLEPLQPESDRAVFKEKRGVSGPGRSGQRARMLKNRITTQTISYAATGWRRMPSPWFQPQGRRVAFPDVWSHSPESWHPTRPITRPSTIGVTQASPVAERHPMTRLPNSTARVPPRKPPSTHLPASHNAGSWRWVRAGRCQRMCRPLLPSAAPNTAQASRTNRSRGGGGLRGRAREYHRAAMK